MVERQEQGARPGGQRQPPQPAADRLAPPPPRPARRQDEQGCQDDFQGQGTHRELHFSTSVTPAKAGVHKHRLWNMDPSFRRGDASDLTWEGLVVLKQRTPRAFSVIFLPSWKFYAAMSRA